MIEIRFHGRGGQGAVTSAELLAHAAIAEGKFAQAFPSFGPERRGAPVLAFSRISDTVILLREQVYEPDVVIVLDDALLKIADVTAGLKDDGVIIVNTAKSMDEIREIIDYQGRLAIVDALHIAMEILKRPITNTTMLGAFIKATGDIKLESMREPLNERFGRIAEVNYLVMEKAYKTTKVENGK